MAEVKVVRTPSPKYDVIPGFPFAGRDLFAHPLKLMRRLSQEMDRALADKGFGDSQEPSWRPAIEVKRDKDRLLVHAELPGLNGEDVKVTVTGDLLEIEGERKLESDEKHQGFIHSERSYGRFYRAIPMPDGANAEQAEAQFANGMLEISIPVPEAVPVAKEIKVGEGKPAPELTH
jgi:HSP20 family protein